MEIAVQIGSNEHKELFCRSFLDSHRVYDPRDWPWPELDELSLARLRAIPIWTLALEIELGAGKMLQDYAQTERDSLVREALALQGYEEDRHGRILQCLVERYALQVTPEVPQKAPTRGAFMAFGYDECVDSFAGFGIFRLARDARILPETLTSLFTRLLVEEARHIVFFINWIAWDRYRRGLRGAALQAIPALCSYGASIGRHVQSSSRMQREKPEGDSSDLFGDVLKDLTLTRFLRACVDENDRYMAAFDPRLLRPRVIPALGRVALGIAETIERVQAAFPKSASRSTS